MQNIIHFPFEILIDICSYIDIYSLYALSITCKDLTFVLKHPPFWLRIEFTNPEEQEQIELDFLNTLSQSTISSSSSTKMSQWSQLPARTSSIISSEISSSPSPSPLSSSTISSFRKFSKTPYKLSRINDKCIDQLLKMLSKNNLVNIVNLINLDFTLITSLAILKLSSSLPNLEEVSLRGCQRISLRGLGQDLSWSVQLKLKKLNVIWCKDMDPRLIFKQDVINNFNGINYYKDILKFFKNSLPTKVELDIDICERCEEHIKFWINCALCKLPKTFCMSCDLIRGCLDCFKFYCCISTSPQNSSSISLPLTSSQQTSPQNSSSPTSSLSLQTKDLISSPPSISSISSISPISPTSLIIQPSDLNSPSTTLTKSLNSIQLSTTTTTITSSTTTYKTILCKRCDRESLVCDTCPQVSCSICNFFVCKRCPVGVFLCKECDKYYCWNDSCTPHYCPPRDLLDIH
ncbi:hypothetical protein Glove_396g82 [Diversispora epigaea]|uniref:F-box domain-containing protein n=1 Tax=Diversispora epigaea TaxID=1348612 RepID=A0A397H577_9GLOM|nr:hypothetical protein Glove_396g82 [Diversispora epigaea]